jgi:LPXTG-site transpeptidase (sortase) family protein
MGMATPLLLVVICVGAILLVTVGSWLLFGSEDDSRIIQIAPIAPLATFVAMPTEGVLESPAEVDEASVLERSPIETENQTPAVEAFSPAPTPDVAEILGFDLPDGAVNSITQEGVATRLLIPKLNLDAPVVVSPIKDQTWQVDHLGQKVGHLEGTAAPGSNSNVVFAGHVTLAQGVYGPFAGLAQLSPGDSMTVYQGDKKFNYVVDEYEIVDRTAIEVTYPSSRGQLTLITCNNWNSETGQYEQRLIVKSHLIEN